VGVIFGCCSSASRKAVLPVVERHGGCSGILPSTKASSTPRTSYMAAQCRTRSWCRSPPISGWLRRSWPEYSTPVDSVGFSPLHRHSVAGAFAQVEADPSHGPASDCVSR
jgi:hypothetical protein